MDGHPPTAPTRVVTTAGWSLAVQVRGAGAPVVLLHGLLTDSRVWWPLVADLQRDHTVVAVDAPGHGLSPARHTEFTLEEEVAGLGQLVEPVLGREPAIWIGHSMGGMKALRAALSRPDLVRALVLVSTQPYREPENTARPFEAMVETVKSFGMSADLAEVVAKLNFHRRFLATPEARRWVEHFATLTGDQIEHACHAVYRRADVSGLLGAVTVPALVVHGTDDVPIRIPVARRYVTLLPQGRLVELPETGHTPPCERPRELVRFVREFIDAQATARETGKEEALWR
jgi:pimeloyl-ACP methyl ester carboxylesterase